MEFKLNTLLARNADSPAVLKKALIGQSVMPLILRIKNEIICGEMRKLVAENRELLRQKM